MHGEGDVNKQSQSDKRDQRSSRSKRIDAAARQLPNPNLNDMNHGDGQEDAAEDGAPDGQNQQASPDNLVLKLLVLLGGADAEMDLESLSY